MTLLDDVYDGVPVVACKGLCQRACGPVACSAIEADAMRDNGINPPTVREHPTHGALACSHLTDAGRCAVYEHRPLVCRLFGAVEDFRCPHGCKTFGPMLKRDEARALIRRLDDGRVPHMPLSDVVYDPPVA